MIFITVSNIIFLLFCWYCKPATCHSLAQGETEVCSLPAKAPAFISSRCTSSILIYEQNEPVTSLSDVVSPQADLFDESTVAAWLKEACFYAKKSIKKSLKLQNAVFKMTITYHNDPGCWTPQSWIAKSNVAKVGYLFSKSFSSGRGTTPRKATALLKPHETPKDMLWTSAIF